MIRSLARYAVIPVLLILIAVTGWIMPSQTPTTAIILPAPSATPSLPVCVTEDGAGQALCTWDAHAQGNGYGEDVISGDCAYEDSTTRELCVTLHGQASYTTEGQNGASNTVPNGVDLVGECQEELQVGKSEWLDSELQECFSAWL